jgi:hypothetical protein
MRRTNRLVENFFVAQVGRKEISNTAQNAVRRRQFVGVARTLARAALCALCLVGVSGCRHKVTLEELPASEIETTLFLIGDAGEPDPHEVGAPLDSLAAQAAVAPERTIIVFLGDNVYPGGIPAEGAAEWADARRRLEEQV